MGSIKFCADDCSTWANRALVRLKLEKPEAALDDCENSLKLNPRYMKALHRKGKALHELMHYEEAVHCFQAALAQSPGNTQINGDLMMARRKLRSEGPAPTERALRNDDQLDGSSRNRIGSNSEKTTPEPGYTRVQIEEDSDTDSDVQVQNQARSGSVASDIASNSAMTVRTAPGDVQAADGVPAVVAHNAGSPPTSTAGMVFHTVQIEEESDSEEDESEQPVIVEMETSQGDFSNASAHGRKVDILEEHGSAVGAVA